MIKTIRLLLLVGLFVTTQAADDDSSAGIEHPHSYSKHSSVVGGPLLNRKFHITLGSVNKIIAAGAIKAIPLFASFFNIKKAANIKGLPSIEDQLFKLKVMEVKVNRNYLNAIKIKSSVTHKFPKVENSILISKEGFQCDEDFCLQAGNEQYAMGICTPFYCDCSKAKPQPNKCELLGEVFDPVFQKCAVSIKVKMCSA